MLVDRRSIIWRVCWRVASAVLRAGVSTGEVMMSSTAMVVEVSDTRRITGTVKAVD